MEIIGQVFLSPHLTPPDTRRMEAHHHWVFYVQGASGSVYSAIDTRTGKKVAVKQMIMSKYVSVSFSFFPRPGG